VGSCVVCCVLRVCARGSGNFYIVNGMLLLSLNLVPLHLRRLSFECEYCACETGARTGPLKGGGGEQKFSPVRPSDKE